jgi:dCTP deaminase
MFWSGETLGARLQSLIYPFDARRIDCAAYTLAVGSEVYVTPPDHSVDAKKVSVQQLNDCEWFTIPPGQFALILSEEDVTVPPDALAFISIRAKTKFRGLVNVSGFHVDPGYRGPLTFSVYNAGPQVIHLHRGAPIFLIWYASLDRTTYFKKSGKPTRGIKPEIVTSISGELQSLASLSEKINNAEDRLQTKLHEIEKEQAFWRIVGTALLVVLAGLALNWFVAFFP